MTLLLVPTIGSWAQVWSQAGLPEEQQTDSALGSSLSLKQDMMNKLERNCLFKLTLPSRQGADTTKVAQLISNISIDNAKKNGG